MVGSLAGLIAAVAVAVASPGRAAPSPSRDVAALGRAVRAHRTGDYERAAKLLRPLAGRGSRTRDFVLYLLGESEFYAGRPGQALAHFRELESDSGSRFASLAGYRAADSAWSSGDHAGAIAIYRRLLGASAEGERSSPRMNRVRQNAYFAGGGLLPDPVVGRFRIALALAETRGSDGRPDTAARARAARAFRAIEREFPAHPLAGEAARRARELAPPAPVDGGEAPPPAERTAQERIARAKTLNEARRFEAAIAELEALPEDLPGAIDAERRYLLGMAKFRTRNDYERSAELLLGVHGKLTGDRAATAAFHGARALARANRDDDAIAEYRRFLQLYANAPEAAQASFLIGWLDFNRRRYREALPGLEETVRRYPRSPEAARALWFIALANVLLGKGQEALAALDRHARAPGKGDRHAEADGRLDHYRARALLLAGRRREAESAWRELVRRDPFSYYGTMARARLRAMGVRAAITLPRWKGPDLQGPPPRDPLLARADDLAAAGLTTEAGLEILRGESALLARLGRERGLPLLLDRYARFGGWRRAHQLAESHGAAALASAPEGAARRWWTAAYPLAFRELVEKFSRRERNPDLFVYTIMRKESAYQPTEVSYADARGLMQLLPALGQRLAGELKVPLGEEELYLPDRNIRLGARYTGGLAQKFSGNVALAAGAYNAGPGAVTRWCDRNGSRPLDDFIELVAYDDTREYMKRVVAIHARYHYLYKRRPFEPALTVVGCRYKRHIRQD